MVVLVSLMPEFVGYLQHLTYTSTQCDLTMEPEAYKEPEVTHSESDIRKAASRLAHQFVRKYMSEPLPWDVDTNITLFITVQRLSDDGDYIGTPKTYRVTLARKLETKLVQSQQVQSQQAQEAACPKSN